MNNKIFTIFISFIILLISFSNIIKCDIFNLNYESIITITIKGEGNNAILSSSSLDYNGNYYNFEEIPNKIYINGELQNYTGKEVYNLPDGINNITMKWDNDLINCNAMFYELNNIIRIDLSKFDSSKVINMVGMFASCEQLESIDLTNLDTSKVTSMAYMFSKCTSLTSIDLRSFNTLKVDDMSRMFMTCSSLISLDLSNFKTPSLKNMSFMFFYCIALVSIKMNNFITSSVLYFESSFSNCKKLTSIDISYFDLSSANELNQIFSTCSSLKEIHINFINTLKINYISRLFYRCNSLEIVDLGNMDTSSVTSMNEVFLECFSLKSINIGNFNISKVESMNKVFYGCDSLISLKINNNFNINSINDMSSNLNSNAETIYCINDDKTQNSFGNIKNNCNDICFKENKKINLEKKICLSECSEQNYQYEYNGVCYESCPVGTMSFDNSFICKKESNYETDIIEPSTIKDSIINSTLLSEHTLEVNTIVDSKSNEYKKEKEVDITFTLTNKNTIKENSTIERSIIISTAIEDILTEEKITNLPIRNNSLIDFIISNITNNIIYGKIDLSNLIYKDKKDIIIKENNTILEITTSNNQKNNEYENISTIDLGECENTLRRIYKINETLPLIIFKVDCFVPGILIPVIGYNVFHPDNKSLLNLTYCEKSEVDISIPVSLNESILFKYEPESDYYNDICFPYTTDNGTDILLNDRHDEFNSKNYSLCEKNCKFKGYREDTKKYNCKCGIKINQIVISELNESNNLLLSNNFIDENVDTNMVTMKCYYTLFTKDGLNKNIGNYIIISSTIIFIILAILFYKVGFPIIEEKINKIIESKKKNRNRFKESTRRVPNQKTIKKKNKKKHIHNPIKKKSSKKISNNVKFNIKNNSSDSKLSSKLEQTKSSVMHIKEKNHLNEINIYNKHKKHNSKKNKIINYNDYNDYNDYELNRFTYEEALKNDKRGFCSYYISLIRAKHPLIFSFCPLKDYNSRIIKLSLFLLLIIVIYASNALFFNETLIHRIYKDEGFYNFKFFIPYIIYSFIISHIFYSLIKFLFLSERNILKIKKLVKIKADLDKVDRIKKNLNIKYICFFPLGLVLHIFIWYYLSSLGSVFQNTQIFIVKNALICFGIALIYPIFINLLPSTFRTISLNHKKRCYYNLSRFLQLI